MLAPLVIYPLWKCKRTGLHLLWILAAISVIVPFYITYTQNLDPTFIVWPKYAQCLINWANDSNKTLIYLAKSPICLQTIISSTHTERLTCDRPLTFSVFSRASSLFIFTRSSKFIICLMNYDKRLAQLIFLIWILQSNFFFVSAD